MNTETTSVTKPSGSPVSYRLPPRWLRYDFAKVHQPLAAAKATLMSLVSAPFQREWVDKLQQIQLKMEVGGTSRIEGADFTERELEQAINEKSTPADLITHSQRQAHAAVNTYRWLTTIPPDRPLDAALLKEIHAKIVEDCDDDHCAPGRLREESHNVTFGVPRHRGCEGGSECESAFEQMIHAVRREFPDHDSLVQALALHYHVAAMHPFGDGNGRTARAAEALMLQRAGLRDTAFIAMSNFYYEQKAEYLAKLSEVRARDFDLTPFLVFGLRGIEQQCNKLLGEVRKNIQKVLFRDTMYDLFNRLESTRKRVIKTRQIELLKILLRSEEMDWREFVKASFPHYGALKNRVRAFNRDIGTLVNLGTISVENVGENKWTIRLNLEWPTEITESMFFERIRKMPRGKSYPFLS